MTAVLRAEEPSARYLVNTQPALVRGFELLATAQSGIGHLRQLILEFAIQGKLVSQSARDERASAVVERIQATKGLTASRKTPAAISAKSASELPLPTGWCWSSLNEIGLINPRNQADDSTIASFVQMSSVPVALMQSHLAEPRPWRDIKTGFTHFADGDVGVAKITPCFENGKSTVFRQLDGGIGAGTTELHIVRPLEGVLPEYVLVFLKSPAFLRNGEAVIADSAILSFDACFPDSVVGFVPARAIGDALYVLAFMKTARQRLIDFAPATAQKNINLEVLNNVLIPVPPLAEQHRIVARVEELRSLCAQLRQRLTAARETQSRLADALVAQAV
jgi:Type I restriction modification DNA specificity domain